MKRNIILLYSVLFAGIVVFTSCKKEVTSKDANKPPVPAAGPDKVITLPTDSITLDGNSSTDPDGKIVEWLWTKISGPASFAIDNAKTAIAVVKNLRAGAYRLELKITDDRGLSAKDSLQVVVIDPTLANLPPVANAGADQTITLPNNEVTLDGSGSTDPDNNITGYTWKEVSGQSSFTMVNTNAAQIQVANLIGGVYQFELEVIDAGGLFAKDTMLIIVNSPGSMICAPVDRPTVNARLVPFGFLSLARTDITVASAGNKLLFAGGRGEGGALLASRVDIYDFSTRSWSIAELSLPRYNMATVVVGDKIFFAGGEIPGEIMTNRIDIYDAVSDKWSTEELSDPIGNAAALTSVGNKVFFTGGEPYSLTSGRVDIYDVSTKSWSTANLSQPRFRITATTGNNKIFFAGGEYFNGGILQPSSIIDIYDDATGSWSVSRLDEPKSGMSGIFHDEKIYWAGGEIGYDHINEEPIYTCKVEVRDVNSQITTFTYLSERQSWQYNDRRAIAADNKIIFFNYSHVFNKRFDIYDLATKSWSIGELPQVISLASITSVNSTFFLAGGAVNANSFNLSNQVWKLEF